MLQLKALPAEELRSLAFVVVITTVLTAGGLMSLVHDKPSFSPLEKRRLAPVPSLNAKSWVSGRFTRGLSIHYADTFPFRDALLSHHHRFDEWKGFRYDDLKVYFQAPGGPAAEDDDWGEDDPLADGGFGWDSLAGGLVRRGTAARATPGGTRLAQTTARPDPRAADGQVKGTPGGGNPVVREVPSEDHRKVEKLQNVVVYGDAAFYIYGGSTKSADRYAAVLNKAAAVLGTRAKVYSMMVPTAVEYYLPSKYRSFSNSQRDLMRHVFGRLQSVTAVDVYQALASHKDEYLYYRTDHHWTALGAFYAYEEFAKALGYKPNPLSAYQEIVIGKFWGTMYAATRSSALARHSDVVTAYKPAGRYTVKNFDSAGRSAGNGAIVLEAAKNMSDKFVAFITGDHPYIRIVNDGTPRRAKKLLVLKESFGNPFVPFLAPDFQEIHVADIRNFPYGLSDFVTSHGIHEVLILNNMFSVCDKDRIRNLQRIVEHE